MLSLNDALFKIPSRHLLKFFMMAAKAFAISITNTVLETYTCYTSVLFFINKWYCMVSNPRNRFRHLLGLLI